MMRLGGRLLLMAVLLCLPLGCAAPNRDNSTTSSQPIFSFTSHLDFAEILPGDWQHIRTYRLNANHDDRNEWVVLYRFDLLNEGGEITGPITAVVYQPDGERPPNLVAHPLHPQDKNYLCKCKCTVTMENVLSGLEGDELIFRDECTDQTSRLTIFHWDDNSQKYVPRGHFCGTCIRINPDEISVLEEIQDRAQLSKCKTYYAFDNRTYYQSNNSAALVLPEKEEIVFSKGEPEDVLRSPYPEKVVLAFYLHYSDDEKAPTYFIEKVRGSLGQCDSGECGCLAPRHEIARVGVTYLQPETYNEPPASDVVRATVGVKVICEPREGAPEEEQFIRWHLVQEDERWQLERRD
jgi:hypothetical protein